MRHLQHTQPHSVQRVIQPLGSGGHVLPFVQAEQAKAKAHVVGRFVARQRHPGGHLHALRGKPDLRHGKAEGLAEKKYMLVHEPEAIALLKNVLKDSYISTEPKRGNHR